MSDTAPVTGATGQRRVSRDGKPLRCLVVRHGRVSQPPANLADLSEILKEPDALVWFDVVDPGPRDLALCQEEFNLHPLAIEDAVTAHERPKIEQYGSYWFVIIHATTLTPAGVAFHEMAVFGGDLVPPPPLGAQASSSGASPPAPTIKTFFEQALGQPNPRPVP